MLGASAWGYIDFNLGLFYGDLGALAGFDVSIRKLSNTQCMNIPRTPGYNGWYAEGQLYAYLYAKFGIHINLGFWDKKLDIIDAGIGGVLRMGLPNPSYFTGEARVKLNLLAGLVKINRKFEFECGERVFSRSYTTVISKSPPIMSFPADEAIPIPATTPMMPF